MTPFTCPLNPQSSPPCFISHCRAFLICFPCYQFLLSLLPLPYLLTYASVTCLSPLASLQSSTHIFTPCFNCVIYLFASYLFILTLPSSLPAAFVYLPLLPSVSPLFPLPLPLLPSLPLSSLFYTLYSAAYPPPCP